MKRIDLLLVEKALAKSRAEASVFIKEGRVTAAGKPVTKASETFDGDCVVTVDYPEERYVSRGGYKLAFALKEFGVDVKNKICLDIGASTGGFTDCLLQNGTLKVYAVDCGTLQLDARLKNSPKVISRERTNARYLKKGDFADKIDLIVMDVSFISQTLVYPAAAEILPESGVMLTLVKPQFELSRAELSKSGIVNDPKGIYFNRICEKIVQASKESGFALIDVIDSPISGGDGNKEYLAFFKRSQTIESGNFSKP